MSEIKRDERGKFVKGTKPPPSPGRKPRAVEADYLRLTIDTVTPEYWGDIVRRAIAQAMQGDAKAREWLGNYVIGRPPQILELRGAEAQQLQQVLDALK